MKKRQPHAAKPRKTRQKHVPKNNGIIHEWDRRLLQAGYIQPARRKPAGKLAKIAAAIALTVIAALITATAYVPHLPANEPTTTPCPHKNGCMYPATFTK